MFVYRGKTMKKYKCKNCKIINNSDINFTYKAICPKCGKEEKTRIITCQIVPIKVQCIRVVCCSKCKNVYDIILEELE